MCIDVPDLDRAVAFYSETFGFEPLPRDGFVELVGAPVPIDLLPREDRSQTAAGAARSFARHWTPVHLDLVVDDVDATVSRAVRLGATLEAGPVDQPFGRIAQLADPFGHGLCILRMSERGYDTPRGQT